MCYKCALAVPVSWIFFTRYITNNSLMLCIISILVQFLVVWNPLLCQAPSFLFANFYIMPCFGFYFTCIEFYRFLCQVKVPVWVDGKEVAEFVGVGARFGKSLESKEKRANQTKLALADPPDCCSTPRNKVSSLSLLISHSTFTINESNVKVSQLLTGFCEESTFILLLTFLLFVCFSLRVRLSWYTVAIVALSPKETLLKMLGLLLYLS